MEGNVSEQQVWREVGEKEGEDRGVFVKGNRWREVVGDWLLEKVYRSGRREAQFGGARFCPVERRGQAGKGGKEAGKTGYFGGEDVEEGIVPRMGWSGWGYVWVHP